MAKDANGEYVRLKCAAKVRKTSYRKRIDALLGSSEVKSISPQTYPPQTQRTPPADSSPPLHGAAKLDGNVPGSSMARCGVPHGTVPDEGLKLSSSVSKRGILPDTATEKPTDKINSKTLGSFAPEPRPGASRHPDPSADVLASRPPVPPPPKPRVPLVDEALTALGHRFMVGDNKCEDCHWYAQTIRQRELTCIELQKKNEDNRREEQMEKARRAFS